MYVCTPSYAVVTHTNTRNHPNYYRLNVWRKQFQKVQKHVFLQPYNTTLDENDLLYVAYSNYKEMKTTYITDHGKEPSTLLWFNLSIRMTGWRYARMANMFTNHRVSSRLEDVIERPFQSSNVVGRGAGWRMDWLTSWEFDGPIDQQLWLDNHLFMGLAGFLWFSGSMTFWYVSFLIPHYKSLI